MEEEMWSDLQSCRQKSNLGSQTLFYREKVHAASSCFEECHQALDTSSRISRIPVFVEARWRHGYGGMLGLKDKPDMRYQTSFSQQDCIADEDIWLYTAFGNRKNQHNRDSGSFPGRILESSVEEKHDRWCKNAHNKIEGQQEWRSCDHQRTGPKSCP